MAILKGIEPSRITPGKWWKTNIIDDPTTLKPSENDVLIVVGDATGVVKDLSEFIELGVPFDTCAINYSARVIPWEIQHFVAGDSHMNDMQTIAKSLNGTLKHCWNPTSDGFDIRWVRNGRSGWNGTTAILGVKIGIAMDYTRIVLCGCPMDNSGNWYQPLIPKDDVKQNKNHTAHLWKWMEIAGRPLARFLRSMSGNTADLLGKPTREWLNGQMA
jgi:hypothetical protein